MATSLLSRPYQREEEEPGAGPAKAPPAGSPLPDRDRGACRRDAPALAGRGERRLPRQVGGHRLQVRQGGGIYALNPQWSMRLAKSCIWALVY